MAPNKLKRSNTVRVAIEKIEKKLHLNDTFDDNNTRGPSFFQIENLKQTQYGPKKITN
jgi:hypothetical protein